MYLFHIMSYLNSSLLTQLVDRNLDLKLAEKANKAHTHKQYMPKNINDIFPKIETSVEGPKEYPGLVSANGNIVIIDLKKCSDIKEIRFDNNKRYEIDNGVLTFESPKNETIYMETIDYIHYILTKETTEITIIHDNEWLYYTITMNNLPRNIIYKCIPGDIKCSKLKLKLGGNVNFNMQDNEVTFKIIGEYKVKFVKLDNSETTIIVKVVENNLSVTDDDYSDLFEYNSGKGLVTFDYSSLLETISTIEISDDNSVQIFSASFGIPNREIDIVHSNMLPYLYPPGSILMIDSENESNYKLSSQDFEKFTISGITGVTCYKRI